MTDVFRVNPDEIHIEERARKSFDSSAITRLAMSIEKYGQLQPGVCTKSDGKFILIAGERRLRACRQLDREYDFVLLEEIEDGVFLEELELEENLQREDLTWQEEIAAKKRIHELYQERYGKTSPGAKGGHTLKDTAERIGTAVGGLADDITLSDWLDLPEIRNAKTKSDAKKATKRIQKEGLRKIILDRYKKMDTQAELGVTPEQKVVKNMARIQERCWQGKMEALLPLVSDGYFDLVIFDPPWSVRLDEVTVGTETTRNYNDSEGLLERDLSDWLALIYSKMAEDSLLFMFFPITKHEYVYTMLESKLLDMKFSVNRMPIFWVKEGPGTGRTPDIWPTRSYEPIAVARKGKKRFQKADNDIIITPRPTKTMKDGHPSVKHPSVILNLLERGAGLNAKILDPMSGSGMTGVAADYLGKEKRWEWTLIEEIEEFSNLGIFNINKGYEKIVRKRGEEDEE